VGEVWLDAGMGGGRNGEFMESEAKKFRQLERVTGHLAADAGVDASLVGHLYDSAQ